jgi:hypothetical protein
MKSFLALLLASCALVARGAPREPAEFLARAVARGEATWTAAQDPAKHNPRTSELFVYALALCEARQHPDRLPRLFELAAAKQDRDPQSPNHGTFRWQWNDTAIVDQNAIEFSMQPASVLWLRHREGMPAAARERLRAILEPGAVIASLRHRVADGYTNIALMSASNLIILGEGLGRVDVADEGYRRLGAVFDLTRRSGIREYVSPDYYGVDLDALQLAAAFAQRPAGRRQAQALLELFWTSVAANFWWPNLRLCGAHGRNYDYLHGTGGLDRHLWGAGWIDAGYDPGTSAVFLALARWWPPTHLVELSRRQLPRFVRQTWGTARQAATGTPGAPERPATAGGKDWAVFTHWVGKDVTLSVGGANYGPIDIPLAVDFPGSRDRVRCFFLPDGRGDPYGKSKIPWRGHPKAVHLQPFFAAAQQARDALALVVYRDQDVPAECTTLHSHFVMPRAVDGVFVGSQRVTFETGTPKSVPMPPGGALFLRQGTAALALRVPVARTLAGDAPPVALVWDDNEWGAIRLTVDHRLSGRPGKGNAAAVFQVHVGSELNEAGFAEFRRAFQATACEVAATTDAISVRSPGAQGALVIAAEAPWSRPSLLEPVQPTAVLEIDGKDVGADLLQAAR